MLATLIPLFDSNMNVRAYSLFTQAKNPYTNPTLLGIGANDGVALIGGLEVIKDLGLHEIAGDKDIFVQVSNVALFSNIETIYGEDPGRLVILVNADVLPEERYVRRMKELRDKGFRFAISGLGVSKFEAYREILKLVNYVFLDFNRIQISKARIYFTRLFPHINLCAGQIENIETFQRLKKEGGYQFYEGDFYRTPLSKGNHDVSPLKINRLHLLALINEPVLDFDKAAEIISRDPALVISLLELANRMARNSTIKSIQQAAAMLGENELKKWLTVGIVEDMCQDKPNEITRLSLLRAKFAENLAPLFSMAMQAQELFLMGLFSLLDVILDIPIKEALEKVRVEGKIRDALVDKKGDFVEVMNFIVAHESANFNEVCRVMVVQDMEMDIMYEKYLETLRWYREIIS